jgi:hypothetical protein
MVASAGVRLPAGPAVIAPDAAVVVDVDQDEVDRIVTEVLGVLARSNARGPDAYVALMLIGSTIMLGLEELPPIRTINLILARLFPVWNRLIDEQVGKPVH